MEDDRPNDVRMALTTANKSHSWRGEHPIKDQNGYVSSNDETSFTNIRSNLYRNEMLTVYVLH